MTFYLWHLVIVGIGAFFLGLVIAALLASGTLAEREEYIAELHRRLSARR